MPAGRYARSASSATRGFEHAFLRPPKQSSRRRGLVRTHSRLLARAPHRCGPLPPADPRGRGLGEGGRSPGARAIPARWRQPSPPATTSGSSRAIWCAATPGPAVPWMPSSPTASAPASSRSRSRPTLRSVKRSTRSGGIGARRPTPTVSPISTASRRSPAGPCWRAANVSCGSGYAGPRTVSRCRFRSSSWKPSMCRSPSTRHCRAATWCGAASSSTGWAEGSLTT